MPAGFYRDVVVAGIDVAERMVTLLDDDGSMPSVFRAFFGVSMLPRPRR